MDSDGSRELLLAGGNDLLELVDFISTALLESIGSGLRVIKGDQRLLLLRLCIVLDLLVVLIELGVRSFEAAQAVLQLTFAKTSLLALHLSAMCLLIELANLSLLLHNFLFLIDGILLGLSLGVPRSALAVVEGPLHLSQLLRDPCHLIVALGEGGFRVRKFLLRLMHFSDQFVMLGEGVLQLGSCLVTLLAQLPCLVLHAGPKLVALRALFLYYSTQFRLSAITVGLQLAHLIFVLAGGLEQFLLQFYSALLSGSKLAISVAERLVKMGGAHFTLLHVLLELCELRLQVVLILLHLSLQRLLFGGQLLDEAIKLFNLNLGGLMVLIDLLELRL